MVMGESKKVFMVENPRRLCSFFRSIRVDMFDNCGVREMANLLQSATRTTTHDGKQVPVAAFSKDIVSSLERGHSQIRYIHVETYARLIGVRAGILLMFSYLQHVEQGELKEHVAAFSEVLSPIADRKGVITVRELAKYASLISSASELENNDLTETRPNETDLDKQNLLLAKSPERDIDMDFEQLWKPLD
jgi:hypothetical protein